MPERKIVDKSFINEEAVLSAFERLLEYGEARENGEQIDHVVDLDSRDSLACFMDHHGRQLLHLARRGADPNGSCAEATGKETGLNSFLIRWVALFETTRKDAK